MRIPRYCLLGNTIKIAYRIQATFQGKVCIPRTILLALQNTLTQTLTPDPPDSPRQATAMKICFLADQNINPRMPRYCIFGDTINIASHMQTTSEGTYQNLPHRRTKD